jgi:hypothetical protein
LFVASISSRVAFTAIGGGFVLREHTVRAYEGFLELPVPVVLAVLWVAGAVLEVLCVIAVYEALVVVLL